MTGGCY